FEHAHFAGTAHYGVAVLTVDPTQRENQTPDVGANSEVSDAAGVDDDVRGHPTPERRRASSCRAGSVGSRLPLFDARRRWLLHCRYWLAPPRSACLPRAFHFRRSRAW